MPQIFQGVCLSFYLNNTRRISYLRYATDIVFGFQDQVTWRDGDWWFGVGRWVKLGPRWDGMGRRILKFWIGVEVGMGMGMGMIRWDEECEYACWLYIKKKTSWSYVLESMGWILKWDPFSSLLEHTWLPHWMSWSTSILYISETVFRILQLVLCLLSWRMNQGFESFGLSEVVHVDMRVPELALLKGIACLFVDCAIFWVQKEP